MFENSTFIQTVPRCYLQPLSLHLMLTLTENVDVMLPGAANVRSVGAAFTYTVGRDPPLPQCGF